MSVLSPEANARARRLTPEKEKVKVEGLEEHGVHHEVRSEHVVLQGKAQHQENEWQAFTKLNPKQQRDIIEGFEKASNITQSSYENQIQAVADSIPKGFYNVGKGLYDSAIAAGIFIIEAADRPEKIPEAAHTLAMNLSSTLINGLKISEVIAGYSLEVAHSGDYNRPLRDLQTVTKLADERWQALPLELRTERASELIAEMGVGSLIGAADKLARSGKLVDFLEDLAKYAGDLTSPGREKARQALGAFLDDLYQPKALTTSGFEMPIPKDSRDLIAKMVGRSGDYNPESKPMFLAPGAKKVLNEREIESFGGLKNLDGMTDGELASLGLRRYELPKMKLEIDDYSFQAKILGDQKAWVRVIQRQPGVIEATDLYRGSLPEGSGAFFFAETLRAHGVLPHQQLILKSIVNPETIKAFRAGVQPEDTLVGKVAYKALKELGLKAKTCRYEIIGDRLNIVIETSRQIP